MNSAVAAVDISLQNILFATDFSPCSEAALGYAAGLSRQYGSTLYTVNVIPEEGSDVQPPDPFHLRHTAEQKMAGLLQSDPFAGIKHREVLKEGEISSVLCELIRSLGIDLLVLGTHGRSGLKKVILGSVAEQLFRLASCPVLTVGPHVRADMEENKLRQILFATDFGSASLHSLSYALSLAIKHGARLTLSHVVSPLPLPEGGPYWYVETDLIRREKKAKLEAIGRLKKLIPPDVDLRPDADFVTTLDDVPEGILKTAEDCRADVIIMGVKQSASARISAHLPWAVAHEVVCRAKCPVLTVRG